MVALSLFYKTFFPIVWSGERRLENHFIFICKNIFYPVIVDKNKLTPWGSPLHLQGLDWKWKLHWCLTKSEYGDHMVFKYSSIIQERWWMNVWIGYYWFKYCIKLYPSCKIHHFVKMNFCIQTKMIEFFTTLSMMSVLERVHPNFNQNTWRK